MEGWRGGGRGVGKSGGARSKGVLCPYKAREILVACWGTGGTGQVTNKTRCDA